MGSTMPCEIDDCALFAQRTLGGELEAEIVGH